VDCTGAMNSTLSPVHSTISPIFLIQSRRHSDGQMVLELYSEPAAAALGITQRFVQDNHSMSKPAFTLRGLHFHESPRGEDKLVRCVRGRIFDVVVASRAGSPTYGASTGAELSTEDGRQLFVTVGFAHGFLTLESECEVMHRCSDIYAPAHKGRLRWMTRHSA
jgi:dTDP-4-dehydrorhamnose 3,5-epimerase